MQEPAAQPALDSHFLIVLGSSRSGTHLLKRILTTDASFTEISETFRPTNFDEYHGSSNFWRFLRDHPSIEKPSPLTVEQRNTQWRAYLEFLIENFPDNTKILDFKYNNLRSADVGYLWPEETPTMLRLAIEARIPVVRLKRQNHLELFCSQRLAEKTDEWVRPVGDIPDVKPVSAPAHIRIHAPNQLPNVLATMEMREKLVDSWLGGYARKLELIYEELLVDGQLAPRVLEKLEKFFDHSLSLVPEPRTQKITPPLDKLIENYRDVELALAGTHYAAFLPRKPKFTGKPRTRTGETQSEERTHWVQARIVSSRPLVSLMAIATDLLAFRPLSELAPEIFDTPRALHLLHLPRTLEADGGRKLAASIARVRKQFPGHIFVPLTATEDETFQLAQQDIPSLVSNGSIFIDENIWRPRSREIPELPMFDAIYNARLIPEKRHHLAAGINQLLLAYPHSPKPSEDYERVLKILPNAFFANHRLAGGSQFDRDFVSRLYGHSRVGLCLSPVEGVMRASMEYLLAGLPLVSTPSIGGRERYYVAPYCCVVDPNPDAVAAAVRDLAAKNLDRQKIRNHVAQMIGLERHNFLINVNKIAKLHLGKDNLIPSMAPLIGALADYFPAPRVAAAIRAEFASLESRS